MHMKMGSGRRSKGGAGDAKVVHSPGSRFAPCPVCGRSVAIALVHEHLNACLVAPDKVAQPAESPCETLGTAADKIAESAGASSQGVAKTEVEVKRSSASLPGLDSCTKRQKLESDLSLTTEQVQGPEGGQGEVPSEDSKAQLKEGLLTAPADSAGSLETPAESRTHSAAEDKKVSKKEEEGQRGASTSEAILLGIDISSGHVGHLQASACNVEGAVNGFLEVPRGPGIREGPVQLQDLGATVLESLQVESDVDKSPAERTTLVRTDSPAERKGEHEESSSRAVPQSIAPIFKKPNKVVYLIRHGNTMMNSGAAFSPCNIQNEEGNDAAGSSVAARTDRSGRIFDVPLSPLGFKQAAALQNKLPGLKAEVILVSPLTRALQTCREALGGLQVPIEVTARHTEHIACCGDVGRPPSVLATEFPAFDLSRLPSVWWHSPTGAPNNALSGTFLSRESMSHLRERVQRFRAYLLQRPEKTLVVIGHSTFFRELLGSKSRMGHCEIVQLRL